MTRGPSFEPIDEVRRITNFSTGELGTLLCDQLSAGGFEFVAFVGRMQRIVRLPNRLRLSRSPQTTNSMSGFPNFRWRRMSSESFMQLLSATTACATSRRLMAKVSSAPRFPSRQGGLTLTLEPATKVISKIRDWFPASRIVGWKYELEGTREVVYLT